MNRSKQTGTSWETAIACRDPKRLGYLNQNGFVYAERRAPSGRLDTGDITGVAGVVIEAKSCKSFDLAGWLDEATSEAVNAGVDIGVVWFKRRGKSSPGDGYVLMDGATFVRLLGS